MLLHLRDVLHAVSNGSAWLGLGWLVTPNERLAGKSPIESIEHDSEAALSAYKVVGVQAGG